MVSFFIEATRTPWGHWFPPPASTVSGPQARVLQPSRAAHSGVLLLLFGDQILDKRNLDFFFWRSREGGH